MIEHDWRSMTTSVRGLLFGGLGSNIRMGYPDYVLLRSDEGFGTCISARGYRSARFQGSASLVLSTCFAVWQVRLAASAMQPDVISVQTPCSGFYARNVPRVTGDVLSRHYDDLLPFAEAFNVEFATNAARDTPRDEGIAETNAMAKLSSLESDDQ